jgi:hypothetical protein
MDIQSHFTALTAILEDIGERVEGNLYCDIRPSNITGNIAKINNLRSLCCDKAKICEIGVNACHSLLFMVDVNKTAEYALFDIGIHKYLEPCFAYVKSAFPTTQMQLFQGDSRLTLPAYAELHKEEFDLCHIDGGHEYDVFSSDYTYCLQMLKKGGIMIFDDFEYGNIQKFVIDKVDEGEVMFLSGKGITFTTDHVALVKV